MADTAVAHPVPGLTRVAVIVSARNAALPPGVRIPAGDRALGRAA